MRGRAIRIKRSRTSYIRGPRRVTLAPMAWSLRSLKFAMLFFERVSAGFWPVIKASSDFASSNACLVSAELAMQVFTTTFCRRGT